MKVLVCGGRDFEDWERLFKTLDEVTTGQTKVHVIHGAARGADQIGGLWAHRKRFAVTTYPAYWGGYGRAAGPIRNQFMLDDGKPDVVVACAGGAGTRDMVRRAQAAGVRVIFV